MSQICRKIVHVNIRWSILDFRQFFQFIWDRILSCSIGKPVKYRRLTRGPSSSPTTPEAVESGGLLSSSSQHLSTTTSFDGSDLVSLKISLLGDCQIGKTSFVIKYVGDEQEKKSLEMTGLNLMDKTLIVEGARITFSLWDVGGDSRSVDHVPIACKDAVAILFMFDLTSRCTLNSVIEWYSEARKWNQGPNLMILCNFPPICNRQLSLRQGHMQRQ
ncbi:protein TEM1 isoform X3 [Euphorbia lathyris]|uniref:protein TEM1 isoform X3 n=1 Tax=Euphorbia lathyris TaxID=212925 RepID=UPI0033132F12